MFGCFGRSSLPYIGQHTLRQIIFFLEARRPAGINWQVGNIKTHLPSFCKEVAHRCEWNVWVSRKSWSKSGGLTVMRGGAKSVIVWCNWCATLFGVRCIVRNVFSGVNPRRIGLSKLRSQENIFEDEKVWLILGRYWLGK